MTRNLNLLNRDFYFDFVDLVRSNRLFLNPWKVWGKFLIQRSIDSIVGFARWSKSVDGSVGFLNRNNGYSNMYSFLIFL